MMMRILLLFCLVLAVPAGAETKVPQSRAEISLGFAPLVREAAPAVVNIYVRRVVAGRAPRFTNDPFFREFFRDFAPARPQVQNSLGSGVILSADGIVVSNYHVVGEATDIRVVLTDRREFSARVLLADEESDLAILQLDGAQDMPFLTLRDSDSVEVGELVLAIGNPFGVGQTVSSGIVSGLARSGTATGSGRGYFIQTDAAINPGNSGGALVDVNGQVIGINTRILTRSGGSNGIGFAIPSSLVAQFVAQARAGHDRFQRPWAGMSGQPVDADLAEGLGMVRPEGMIVAELHPASPFAAAGFRAGDVITSVEGLPVNTPAEMVHRMSVAGIGAEVIFGRVRGGEADEVTVRLIAPPDEPPREVTELGRRDVLPGLVVARLNPAVAAEHDLQSFAEGVVVLDPGPLGPRVGLQKGDILRAVNRAEPTGPGDIGPLLRRAGRRVELLVERDGRRVVLAFRL